MHLHREKLIYNRMNRKNNNNLQNVKRKTSKLIQSFSSSNRLYFICDVQYAIFSSWIFVHLSISLPFNSFELWWIFDKEKIKSKILGSTQKQNIGKWFNFSVSFSLLFQANKISIYLSTSQKYKWIVNKIDGKQITFRPSSSSLSRFLLSHLKRKVYQIHISEAKKKEKEKKMKKMN